MIDLAALLNTDALSTFREALESHVFFRLSDHHYRDNENDRVIAPGSDHPERAAEIAIACELAREIDRVLEEGPTLLPLLLVEIEARELAAPEITYRCACSWVGGDPDIGPGRKLRGKPLPATKPTCPACWKHDKRRKLVVGGAL